MDAFHSVDLSAPPRLYAARPCHAFARARNSATVNSSARRVPAIPHAASNASASGVSCLRLARSIFRRWPNAAVVRVSRVWRRQGGVGSIIGSNRTTDEDTFGCGVNANLAAMVANPEDLIHGREGSGVGDNRTAVKALQYYRTAPPTGKDGLKEISTKKGNQ